MATVDEEPTVPDVSNMQAEGEPSVQAEPSAQGAEATTDQPAEKVGLRNRKQSAVEKQFSDAVDGLAPEKLKPHLKKLAPAAEAVAAFYAKAQPILQQGREKLTEVWAKIEPYHPEEFGPVIMGLVMAFFGGNFIFLLAAVEAFRIVAYNQMTDAYSKFRTNYVRAKEAWVKDDELDDDKDGVADVNQIEAKKELAKRKALLVLRTVNPEDVGGAMSSFVAGILAILATLRLRLAKAITLGSTVGGIMGNSIHTLLAPRILPHVDAEYKKWILPVILYGTKTTMVILSWLFFRVAYAGHSSIRGSQMFAKGILRWAQRNNYLKADVAELSKRREFVIVTGIVSAMGFGFQVLRGFQLPLLLYIFLLPVTFLEYFVEYLVSWA